MWIAAVVVVVLLLLVTLWSPMTWCASSSGKLFYVKRGPGQELVANRLELLTRQMHELLDAADAMYPGDARIANVRARWTGTLSETEQEGDIAFTMSKQTVSVCVRAPRGGLESENTTMYVLLHEIAHVATNTYGHTPVYWRNFRWFLEIAEKLNFYTYQDFDAIQTTFCGHSLGNNVLSCVKKKTCKTLLA